MYGHSEQAKIELLRIFLKYALHWSQITIQTYHKQECIPVGCVPVPHWPYAGVCFLGGVCSQGGVSAPGGSGLGGASGPGGVCSGGGYLVCGDLVWGVSAPGGVSGPGGLLPGGWGWYRSMHWGRPPPLWTESQTPVKTLPWPNFVAAGNDKNINNTSDSIKTSTKVRHQILKKFRKLRFTLRFVFALWRRTLDFMLIRILRISLFLFCRSCNYSMIYVPSDSFHDASEVYSNTETFTQHTMEKILFACFLKVYMSPFKSWQITCLQISSYLFWITTNDQCKCIE